MPNKLHPFLSTTMHSNYTTFCYDKIHDKNCGRWGETGQEKGPGDLFPVEPTDETFMSRRTRSGGPRFCADRSEAETTLNPGFK